MNFQKWNLVWALLFALEAFFAVGGNIVTIIIFQNRQLRKRTHFLFISLAVADVLVGLLSIPLYIAANYVPKRSHVFRALVQGADMLPGFASIFTLTVIALERMYAIGWPFRHRVLQIQTYIVAIATSWIMAFVVTLSANLLDFVINKSSVALTTIFLITPIVLTCIAYLVLWKKERSRLLHRREIQETRGESLTKTVGLITAAFLVTWIPFQILNLVATQCSSCEISLVVVIVTKLLHYANSIVNIIIYPVRNREYKAALFQMFSSIYNYFRRNRSITQSSATTENSNVFVVRKPSDTGHF
ncbi:PREDICTED: adenosine receptor A1-like [Acropora digitifera]|uniref:adenosine receptor A1-like n=1 Tax=Acropora digitifera TaxID=70779 RepID=UPI00077A53D5|nr:PREDICTED: adenosine receptor A1-like [Acropora digitifera]